MTVRRRLGAVLGHAKGSERHGLAAAAPAALAEARLGRGSRRGRLAAVAALLPLVAPAIAAGGEGPRPLEPRVDGGEERWRAQPTFTVRWTNPPRNGQPPLAAVRYRLLDPAGRKLDEGRLHQPATAISNLVVPTAPGAYRAEIRLEDAAGASGEPAVVTLRFDNARPGPVAPASPSGWLGRRAFPYRLRLGQPAGPPPLSGISGYATSVGPRPTSPCGGAKTCTATETDLRGGVEENLLTIPDLPEGTNHLRAVAVSGAGVRSALAGEAVLRVDKTDPATHLDGAPAGWSRGPVRLTATATDAASGMEPGTGVGPFTAIRVGSGAPTVAAGDRVTATVIAPGVHVVAHYARDAAGNVADGAVGDGRTNPAPATAVVRIDREPPELAFAVAQDPTDPERIEARVGDRLAGIDPASASIAVRPAGSVEPFRALPSRVGAGSLVARWDSEAEPPGEYEFRASARDRAGNAATTLARVGGAPMLLSNPIKVLTALRIDLEARPGAAPVLRGLLRVGRRAGLAGAPVRISERFDPGARPRERLTTVATDQHGRFRLPLGPGPSRTIVASFAPTAAMRGAASGSLRHEVGGRVRLAASTRVARVGGRPVVFSGTVGGEGAAVPADGKIVQLQFRLPGLPWREFRTVRSDRRGRFRYAYRFADDDSRGARFQFRAVAPAQAGWPFAPAGSRPLSVRGR